MSLDRRIGFGILLGVDKTGGTSFTNVANIVDGFEGGTAKAEVADISILSDLYKRKAKSMLDGGQVTFSVAYDPNDTNSKLLGDMFVDVTQVEPNWQISYYAVGGGSTATETFKAILVGMTRSVKRGSLLSCNITLDTTGNAGYAHTT